MKVFASTRLTAATLSMVTLGLTMSLRPAAAPALAQQDSPKATRSELRPLPAVLEQLSQNGNAVVVADSTVRNARVPLSAVTSADTSLEQQVKAVVRSLPSGTVWIKLYLPSPAGGRWDGDAVAWYAQAQARLLNKRVGSETKPGMLEILGETMPEETGRTYVNGLRLKLVYLISNPQTRQASLGPSAGATLEQFRSMDAASRLQALHQQMELMRALQQSMTPEELVQLKMMHATPADREKMERVIITKP